MSLGHLNFFCDLLGHAWSMIFIRISSRRHFLSLEKPLFLNSFNA